MALDSMDNPIQIKSWQNNQTTSTIYLGIHDMDLAKDMVELKEA